MKTTEMAAGKTATKKITVQTTRTYKDNNPYIALITGYDNYYTYKRKFVGEKFYEGYACQIFADISGEDGQLIEVKEDLNDEKVKKVRRRYITLDGQLKPLPYETIPEQRFFYQLVGMAPTERVAAIRAQMQPAITV